MLRWPCCKQGLVTIMLVTIMSKTASIERHCSTMKRQRNEMKCNSPPPTSHGVTILDHDLLHGNMAQCIHSTGVT